MARGGGRRARRHGLIFFGNTHAAPHLPAPAVAAASSPPDAAAAGLRFFFVFDASKIASRSCGRERKAWCGVVG